VLAQLVVHVWTSALATHEPRHSMSDTQLGFPSQALPVEQQLAVTQLVHADGTEIPAAE
jgi:hypothetical protein